jgi:hypothetical protein
MPCKGLKSELVGELHEPVQVPAQAYKLVGSTHKRKIVCGLCYCGSSIAIYRTNLARVPSVQFRVLLLAGPTTTDLCLVDTCMPFTAVELPSTL